MRRVELLMVLAIALVGGTVLEPWTAQPASRYLLTVAIVEHHSLSLDENSHLLEVDHAWRDGHFYSDKAPYQALLSTPIYKAFRAAGGATFPHGPDGPDPNLGVHWGRWLVTLWSSTLPAAVLCIVMRRLVARVHPEVATITALSLSLSTMLLPFSTLLFGHVLSALCLAGGWLLVRNRGRTRVELLVAGALLAAAVGTEFTAAIPAAIVTVALIGSRGWRSAGCLVAGGVIGALPLLVYNWIAFESPISTAYQGHLPNFQGSGALGVYNLTVPKPDELIKMLAGDRGLLTLTPICAIALISAVVGAYRGPVRRDARMALIITSCLCLASAGIDGYGGASPGPRYLIPALPFLAVPLAEAWKRSSLGCTVATIAGCTAMAMATITAPLVGSDQGQALRFWWNRLLDGHLAKSVVSEIAGTWATAALCLLGFLAAYGAVRRDRSLPRGAEGGDTALG